ncbi:MAG: urea carboxylase [Pseudotabrizicola sp.]|uniref:urea carboxylase n=1 Tax=Pseudotabrizicola sp. TaxID=2939647 RepID=UPI00273093F9|nr:urea carboxylase [Pseudotabrizicola sp.]MDZ7574557.1 urea carboxylase [Pseudotabrizicola sp.]
MFNKVLIANRGEIALRVLATLRKMGIASVAVYSDADRFTPVVLQADEAVRLGPAPAAESYLNAAAVIAACKATGAQAVHPGYGFLAENADFAQALADEGIAFIGPRPDHIRAFGLKHAARQIAVDSGVPLLPGSGLLAGLDDALAQAETVGYPVMLKSTAGGGGIGMTLCADAAALRAAWDGVARTAAASFGDARVFLERFVDRARHVEVQVFGDGRGRVIAMGERDCSLQRRNQKVLEETPAPGLTDAVRAGMHRAAVRLCESVSYESAGTVEFIYDPAREAFHFLEVNTRLQVEHPVTEQVFGIDLVEWMIRQAAGEDVIPSDPLTPQGAAIEVRLYAEMPHAGFKPATGRLTNVVFPSDCRVESWVATGTEVTPYYDPMLAKLIVTAPDRAQAIAKLQTALAATRADGIGTNLAYLRAIAGSDLLALGQVATTSLRDFAFAPDLIEVLTPGAQSSVQDLPGRLGLWHVGVPPSGPMDARSFVQANRLVGNADGTAALELTVSGPTLRALADCRVALAGADMPMKVDGQPVTDTVVDLRAGQVLSIGAITGPGQRAYLAVAGGFDLPDIYGSKSNFSLGQFGGHATGTLRAGDILPLARAAQSATPPDGPAPLTHDWQIAVLYGPHGAPDFMQDSDIETLFSAPYQVHYNSSRTGVRLIGPAPQWARADGGEAGLHPSNLHDTAYAVGAIDFTGDMPIILGPDGPSLGGFVCPAVVAREDLWKIGQLRPGNSVRFTPAHRPADPLAGPTIHRAGFDTGSAILAQSPDAPVPVVYRRQGDDNLLVEYGPMVLDIGLRLRVHLLMQAVQAAHLPGLIDLTPGIRSLQIHYDGTTLPRARLLGLLAEIEASLPPVDQVSVPSRIVHLPLSWNDPDIQLAMSRYQETVRPNAPWCPSNIEFIRRMNGLEDEDATRRMIFDASYFVMGLGDVYLGAPVATPLDPAHRLVTTKYNPARTWTPENAVGIGGAYMCIYGMEGPGGYQLFGRTIQMWNTWRQTPAFGAGKPWLLDFFDQIRFFPASHTELTEARAAFPHGAYPVRVEETTFDYAAHQAGLATRADQIAGFKTRQQVAFEAERQRWKDQGLDTFEATSAADVAPVAPVAPVADVPAGCVGVHSLVAGNVWKMMVAPGDNVAAGAPLAIVESMKMEFEVTAPQAGRVRSVAAQAGSNVKSGDTLLVLEDI